MQETKMDCDICCETINGHNKPVKCGFCEFSACSRCTERYLLETHDDAHCMSCRKGWDHGILSDYMTQTFLKKDYRDRRKEVLLDREKSLLPQTQPDVENELAERGRKKLIDSLACQKSLLQKQLNEITITLTDLRDGGVYRGAASGESSTTTRKCPVEDCRGFLSEGWKCGICEADICKACNEPKGEEHECDPNNVETMKLLNKDSKPCPSCGTLITKIDGCDQMWCTLTNCHTAFSWRSGKKVFGVIHNPHFIQFAANNGVAERNPQDLPCGGLPDVYNFFNRVRRFVSMTDPTNNRLQDRFSRSIQFVRHMTHVEEERYRVTDVVHTNTDLRVRYLLKEIDNTQFSNLIIHRDTARKKKKLFHDIVVMIIHTTTDIINIIHTQLTPQLATQVYEQMDVLDKLKDYANEQFKRVGILYKCKFPYINSNWNFERFV
jgi:ribosome-binding protein aMBF1 (putative translation factor)